MRSKIFKKYDKYLNKYDTGTRNGWVTPLLRINVYCHVEVVVHSTFVLFVKIIHIALFV